MAVSTAGGLRQLHSWLHSRILHCRTSPPTPPFILLFQALQDTYAVRVVFSLFPSSSLRASKNPTPSTRSRILKKRARVTNSVSVQSWPAAGSHGPGEEGGEDGLSATKYLLSLQRGMDASHNPNSKRPVINFTVYHNQLYHDYIP